MNQRPLSPVQAFFLLWGMSACANTTAGTDGGVGDAQVVDAGGDVVVDAPLWPQPDPAAPRLVAPLSCTWHSSRRPTLRWVRPAGVERVVVEVCADRPCQRVEHTLEVSGDSVRVPEELPPGAHFWRAFTVVEGRRGAGSFTWGFRAPFRSAPNDLALGTYVDVNGDGYGDVVASTGGDYNIGIVYVFRGGPQGPSQRPDQRLMTHNLLQDIGDLNGDGFADMLSIRRSAPDGRTPAVAEVYLGSLEGLRLSRVPFPRPLVPVGEFYPFISSLGDVNGDGYADIAHTQDPRHAGEFPRVYLGSPSGYENVRSFEFVARSSTATFSFVRLLPVGDFNGDSELDFLVEGWDAIPPKRLEYYVVPAARLRETGMIGLRLLPSEPESNLRSTTPMDARFCDLNGDGRSEIYLQAPTTSSAALRLNIYTHGAGTPNLAPSSIYTPTGTSVAGTLAGGFDYSCSPDLDGDGFNDMLLRSALRRNFIFFGSPTGISDAIEFAPDVRSYLSGIFSSMKRQNTNDIDGDGRPDCALSDFNLKFYSTRGHGVAPDLRYRIDADTTPTGRDGFVSFLF